MAEEIKNRFCDPEAERGLPGIAIRETQEYLRKRRPCRYRDPQNPGAMKHQP